MKEQILTAVLPELPIVGTLKLTSFDGRTLANIEVLRKTKPRGMNPFFERCHQELEKYLTGKSDGFNLELDTRNLTAFQLKVLKAMATIPYGKVATYKDLAKMLRTKGYQAVGSACGKNPFMLIFPCHRVIGSRDLGGFAHGLDMKRELLRLEGFSV